MATSMPSTDPSAYSYATSTQVVPRVVFFSGHAGPSTNSGTDSEGQPAIRTLAIQNLPPDVRERELKNLLIFLPGYQASQVIHDEYEAPEGRAIFDTTVHAQEAISRIDGMVEFDDGYVLKAELATEDLELDESSDAYGSKRYDEEGATHALPPSSHGATMYNILPAGLQVPPGAVPLTPFPPARAYAPVRNEKDNPPINTLFIGNLGENVDENELLAVFGSQPGFLQLKVVRSAKGTSAFVEFADVPSAQLCHDCQQGLMLATSDRGPIRVQYSKNPFGRKKDGSSSTLASLSSARGVVNGTAAAAAAAAGSVASAALMPATGTFAPPAYMNPMSMTQPMMSGAFMPPFATSFVPASGPLIPVAPPIPAGVGAGEMG